MSILRSFGLVVALFGMIFVTAFAQESGKVRFLAHYIPPQGGSYIAGCWGWTDTTSGREYAILGCESGTSIVEITDAGNPIERDFVPGPTSTWHEVQTHSHYAYVVTEAGGGVQIIDLSYLPDSVHLVKSFNYSDGSYNIGRSHTNHIRDGYLYLNGCADWIYSGAVIFDLSDPENPVYSGMTQARYFHDSFVRNDTLFGATIYDGGIDIFDVSDKTNPTPLGRFTYPFAGTHNCATTSDGRYLLTTDEINNTPKTLKIWDITNLSNVTKVAEYQSDPTAVVHNVFVKDTLAFMSYYTDGLRIINISDPVHPVEVGGYDTYPGAGSGYTGAWSTYPFFPSGKIIIGDMVTGLYVVDINTTAPRNPTELTAYSDFQTPSSVSLSWNDPETIMSGDPLTDFTIHIYRDGNLMAVVDSGVEQYTDTVGLILHQKYRYTISAVIASDSSTAAVSEVYAGGHAQPQAPSVLTITSVEGGAKLRWMNPTRQYDDTPLNDLAYIEIYRDNVLVDSVAVASPDTGVYYEYVDSAHGYHWYKILARDNEVPSNASLFSESIFQYAGAVASSYSETFDAGTPDFFITGTWDTTSSIAFSGGTSFTDSPTGNYPAGASSYFLLPPLHVTANHALSFYQIGLIGQSDFGFIDISTDNENFSHLPGGVTHSSFYSQWQDGSADSGDWRYKSFNLSAYAGDTVYLRFYLVSDPGTTMDGWYLDDIVVASTVDVPEEPSHVLPQEITLEQNYPNPFNPATVIRYSLSVNSYVTLKIYDVLGKEVVTLVKEHQASGFKSQVWDASGVPSGVYFYQLTAQEETGNVTVLRKKLVLMR
ncbi:MAG: choice-of-anchor B family protein [Bacteroidetes bacterium]|nr:MAG: choice-of-anchor B family protein [Bacteroidota bacterium]